MRVPIRRIKPIKPHRPTRIRRMYKPQLADINPDMTDPPPIGKKHEIARLQIAHLDLARA